MLCLPSSHFRSLRNRVLLEGSRVPERVLAVSFESLQKRKCRKKRKELEFCEIY